jgi:hypothetical protein
MTPNDKARLAEELFRNEVFHEAFNELESSLVAKWKATPPDSWKSREKLYDQLQALMDLRQQLETFIATGQFARKPN